MNGIDDFEYDFHSAYKDVTDGVNDALSYINNKNLNPTEAVIKSATNNNLNIQKTIRVSESVNKALTLKHLEKSSSDKKGDTFPIVDTAKIVSEMSGNLSKTSSFKNVQDEITEMEKEAEIEAYKQKKMMKPLNIKVAGMLMDTDFGELNEEEETDEDLIAKGEEIEDEISSLMDVYNYSSEKAASAIRNLEKEFNKLYPTSSSDFIKYAMLNYGQYEDALKQLFMNLNENTSGFVFSANDMNKESMQIDFLDKKVSDEVDSFIKYAAMMGVAQARMKMNAENLKIVDLKKKL